jgi:hypothetical protein
VGEITVLISSSVIPSHPSVQIIQETLASIRFHLPHSKIIILLDGVRPEQEHRKIAYLKYLHNLVEKVATGYDPITLWPFIEFTHQALMTMKALTIVKTPLILFAEQDTPLVEKPIDWDFLQKAILEDKLTNHIRLHYDQEIHPDHQHLMHGKVHEHLIKTTQWHQRPHLASTAFYREVLNNNFTEKSRTFIEDKVYSPVSCSPWEDYRLTVYDPNGDGTMMKRSRDLNGRATDPKYPMEF